YLSFGWSYDALSAWVAEHPASSRVLFFEFPPWPWVALMLFGLALGSWWVDADDQSARDRYMRRMAVVGLLCIAWLFAYDWWAETPNRFMFKRDFVLNNHWTPRGATTVWVIGMTFTLMALFYYLAEIRRARVTWLTTFGRTALLLYFVHHLIVLTLVNQRWYLKFNNWWLFGAADVALLAVLLAVSRSWIEIKRVLRQRFPGTAALRRA